MRFDLILDMTQYISLILFLNIITETNLSKGNGTDADPELNDLWRIRHYEQVIGQMRS